MIEELSYGDYSKYHLAIKHIRAREMMDQIGIVSQPWKKKQDQERFIRQLDRDLHKEEVKRMSTQEVFNRLRAING